MSYSGGDVLASTPVRAELVDDVHVSGGYFVAEVPVDIQQCEKQVKHSISHAVVLYLVVIFVSCY